MGLFSLWPIKRDTTEFVKSDNGTSFANREVRKMLEFYKVKYH